MFGGNPGGKQGKEDKLRLGDFWKLHLKRPGRDEVLRKCKILIRQSKFSELAAQDSMVALRYLHTSLSSVVDHNNAQEEREYQLLTSELFRTPATPIGTQNQKRSSKRSREGSPLHHQQQHQQAAASNEDRTYSLRNGLYDKLASHFPERMTHPRGHLIDLIPYTSSLSNDNMLS